MVTMRRRIQPPLKVGGFYAPRDDETLVAVVARYQPCDEIKIHKGEFRPKFAEIEIAVCVQDLENKKFRIVGRLCGFGTTTLR